MRVIIAGSRSIVDYRTVELAVQDSRFEVTEVVSGHADGVDALGEVWASCHNVPVKVFIPNWKENGKAAGPIRNHAMVKYADALVAVWDGHSRGTKDVIQQARRYGLQIYIKTVKRR